MENFNNDRHTSFRDTLSDMSNPVVCVALLLVAVATAWGQAESPTQAETQKSMLFSCFAKPFLSVSVSAAHRDVVSTVQLKLVDSAGREQGDKLRGTPIPRSHYKQIVEVPSAPNRSLVHAVEICGAEPGQYNLTIYEHGSNPYRVDVVADESDADRYALEIRHNSKEGRFRQYRLVFKVDGKQPSVFWLDEQGHEQLHIEDSEW